MSTYNYSLTWIDMVHAIGLTNLSDEQVRRYRELRTKHKATRENKTLPGEKVIDIIKSPLLTIRAAGIRELVITSKRLIAKKGFFRQDVQEVLLQDVVAISFEHDGISRHRTMYIRHVGGTIQMRLIIQPQEVYQELMTSIRRAQEKAKRIAA